MRPPNLEHLDSSFLVPIRDVDYYLAVYALICRPFESFSFASVPLRGFKDQISSFLPTRFATTICSFSVSVMFEYRL